MRLSIYNDKHLLGRGSGWNSDGNGTDAVAFAALPGSYRNYADGTFDDMGDYAIFWSASEGYANDAWGRGLYYSGNVIDRGNDGRRHGFSVRCVQDSP